MIAEPANDKDAAWWAEVRPEVDLIATEHGAGIYWCRPMDYGARMRVAFFLRKERRAGPICDFAMRAPMDDVLDTVRKLLSPKEPA